MEVSEEYKRVLRASFDDGLGPGFFDGLIESSDVRVLDCSVVAVFEFRVPAGYLGVGHYAVLDKIVGDVVRIGLL